MASNKQVAAGVEMARLKFGSLGAAAFSWSTCLIGTTVQEAYASHPNLRLACDRLLSEHVAELTRDLAAAKARYAPRASWDPESVGYFMQCVLQGAFIFAKAKQNAEIATASLGHLRNYLVNLLGHPENERGVAV